MELEKQRKVLESLIDCSASNEDILKQSEIVNNLILKDYEGKEASVKNKMLHSLVIKNEEIKLDNFKLEGVTGYEIKSPAKGTTELTLKILVGVSEIVLDDKKAAAPEVPVQEQPKERFIPEDSTGKCLSTEHCSCPTK